LRFALRSTLTDARAIVGEAGMNPVPIGDWANFFVAEVGASAALTGLIVVAISVNLSKILAYEQLPRRAAEPLVMFVGGGRVAYANAASNIDANSTARPRRAG
jgi:hypothetical protein